jgi:hypothetical protein
MGVTRLFVVPILDKYDDIVALTGQEKHHAAFMRAGN